MAESVESCGRRPKSCDQASVFFWPLAGLLLFCLLAFWRGPNKNLNVLTPQMRAHEFAWKPARQQCLAEKLVGCDSETEQPTNLHGFPAKITSCPPHSHPRPDTSSNGGRPSSALLFFLKPRGFGSQSSLRLALVRKTWPAQTAKPNPAATHRTAARQVQRVFLLGWKQSPQHQLFSCCFPVGVVFLLGVFLLFSPQHQLSLFGAMRMLDSQMDPAKKKRVTTTTPPTNGIGHAKTCSSNLCSFGCCFWLVFLGVVWFLRYVFEQVLPTPLLKAQSSQSLPSWLEKHKHAMQEHKDKHWVF